MARRPNLRAALSNMRYPAPWYTKAWMLVRNNWLKLRHLDNCCGNEGQPGC